ncbi:MAG TPA: hypothetical protein VFU19_15980 [Iamia sp.]|nr:hypothetical protein [Iamia sp.]
MTYCLALRLDAGLVLLSDSLTHEGLDVVGTYRKTHVRRPAEDRTFVLLSAGNLATTQQLLDLVDRDLAPGGRPDGSTLATVDHLFEAALLIGAISRRITDDHRHGRSATGVDGTAAFILGGQVGDEPPGIIEIRPDGSYTHPSDAHPFLQVGDGAYGKPTLDLGVHAGTGLGLAAKVGLASMLASDEAHLSVGPPFDLTVYRAEDRRLVEHRIEGVSAYLDDLRTTWADGMRGVVATLPDLPLPLDG